MSGEAPADAAGDRAYNIGMRYMQQAIIARKARNEALANSFQAKFIAFCEQIQSQDTAKAARLPQDDALALLEKVAEGRNALRRELARVREPRSVAGLRRAYEMATRTCQVLTLCISRGLPPPKIESDYCRCLLTKVNDDVKPNMVRVRLLRLNTHSSKCKRFRLATFGPFNSSDDPTEVTDWFQGGKSVNTEFDIRCLSPRDTHSVMRRAIRFRLLAEMRRGLRTVEAVVAELRVGLSAFQSVSVLVRDFVMDRTPDAPEDDEFSLNVCLKMREPIVDKEYESITVDYMLVARGQTAPGTHVKAAAPGPPAPPPAPARPAAATQQAKASAAPATPQGRAAAATQVAGKPAARSVQSLSAQEKEQLSAVLKSVRIMEQWELDRFMPLTVLKHLLGEVNRAIAYCEGLGLAPMGKHVAQRDALLKRSHDLLGALKSKQLSMAQYRERIRQQAALDFAEIKKRGGPTAPEAAPLFERAKIMQQEYQSLEGKA
jgi:hypothetical protein